MLHPPAGDPREESLRRAVQAFAGTDAAVRQAIAAARVQLAGLSDEDLFVQAVMADAGVLAETRDPGRAVEVAVLLAYCDADGAVATFHRASNPAGAAFPGDATAARPETLYTLTLRPDAAATPPRCRIYCFESGHEIWHATLRNPRAANLIDCLHALLNVP